MRKLTLFFAFLLTMFAGTQVCAETTDLTTLPDGWSVVGATHGTERARTGNAVYTSAKDATSNYLLTGEIEGSLTFYWRSYGTSNSYPNGQVFLYEYNNGTVGNQIAATTTMKSSTWTSVTLSLGSYSGQVAIGLYSACIDDITYTPVTTVNAPSMKVSATSYDFGLATAGTAATFKITNNGNTDYTISASATGGYGTSLSTTTLNQGEEATLTVTMPAATADGVVTISSSDANIADAAISVSGMIRDASKLFADFSEKALPNGWYTSGGNWTYTNEYASEQSYSAYRLVTPRITVNTGDRLYFKYRKNYDSSLSSYSLTVQYTTDDDQSTTSWTNIGNTLTSNYNEWNTLTIDVPSNATYVAFYATRYDIDDIYGLSLYEGPTNLAVTQSSTSATMTWDAANTETAWQVIVSTDVNAIVTATPTNVSGTASYTVDNLTPNTTYYAWVRSDFGGGSYSDWASISFTTLRAPITSFPWTETFNSLTTNGTIPEGWDNSEGTTTNNDYKWCYNSSYSTGHEGKCIRFDSYNNSRNNTNFLKTPVMAFTQNAAMQLKFWYKNPTGGDFSVYISNDGGATHTRELATGLTGKSDWTEYVIDLPTDEYYNNVVIVFKGTSNYGSGDARIYLDDVLVKENEGYAMSISGTDVVNNTIAFGEVKNITTTKTFTISNDGANALTGVLVVSSDATVFTVSDTNFNLSAGETKDITVTFVKGEVGNYSETITVSETNIATPLTLTVTGSYAEPAPAVMAVKIGEDPIPATVAFGTVGKEATITITVANTGEADLVISNITSSNTTDFTVSPATLTVQGGSSETFTVTFLYDATALDAEKTANITVTPSNNGLSPVTFAVTGTRVDMWSEDFEGGAIPEGWENNGFVVKMGTVGSYPTYDLPTYFAVGTGGSAEKTLVTPLLQATAGDKLTFDGFFYYGDETLKVDYSTDRTNWSNLYTYDKSSYTSGSTHEVEITAPITGEFYLRFTVNYYNGVDNIEGFKLAAAKEHEAEIKSTTIPATGNQYVEYTASVNVKVTGTNNEELTAKFYIGNTQYGSDVVKTVTSGETETFTVTFTPDAAVSGDAYFTITNNDIDLTTEPTVVTIVGVYALSEADTENNVEEGNYPVVELTFTVKDGWNSIALPFNVSDPTVFGESVRVYSLNSFAEGTLSFSERNDMLACTPYIIYVEGAKTGPFLFNNVSISTYLANVNNCITENTSGEYSAIHKGTWTKMSADGLYGIVNATGDIRLGTSNATFKAFRSYFDLTYPEGTSIKMNFVNNDGVSTTINAAEVLDELNGDIYDMSGRKVSKVQKGIYIQNGKKVVIK